MKQYDELKEYDLVQIIMVGVRQDCSGKREPSKESGFFCKKCRNELSF
jgi:hypothetical protein